MSLPTFLTRGEMGALRWFPSRLSHRGAELRPPPTPNSFHPAVLQPWISGLEAQGGRSSAHFHPPQWQPWGGSAPSSLGAACGVLWVPPIAQLPSLSAQDRDITALRWHRSAISTTGGFGGELGGGRRTPSSTDCSAVRPPLSVSPQRIRPRPSSSACRTSSASRSRPECRARSSVQLSWQP